MGWKEGRVEGRKDGTETGITWDLLAGDEKYEMTD